jgi:hypothetical protein
MYFTLDKNSVVYKPYMYGSCLNKMGGNVIDVKLRTNWAQLNVPTSYIKIDFPKQLRWFKKFHHLYKLILSYH